MKKILFFAAYVAALSSCSNSSEIERISKELDSLKSVVSTLNGTYSKAANNGNTAKGPQSEDIAERALNACKDRAIKDGMTEEEVIAVLGQPSRKENTAEGYTHLYYGTSECNVELVLAESYDGDIEIFSIHDNTDGKFDEEW